MERLKGKKSQNRFEIENTRPERGINKFLTMLVKIITKKNQKKTHAQCWERQKRRSPKKKAWAHGKEMLLK
jgi:hypothetical protein